MRLSEEKYRAVWRRLDSDPSEIEPPPSLKGIEAFQISNREIRLELTDPTSAEIESLLAWLPPERELFFWDNFYPQLSDPGAGVSVQRSQDSFYYQLGNHGWSSRWLMQSSKVIAAWIMLNVQAEAPFDPLREMTLRRVPSFQLDPKYGLVG